MAEQATRAAQKVHDWQKEPLGDLVAHIKSTHHKYTREEIARLGPLFVKVCSVHGQNHPELVEIRTTFAGLAQELTMHMMKEEMVLFPYIVRMEEAVIQNEPVLPPPFGSVQNPVSMMEHEHDSAGNALRAMRQASNGYAARPMPASASRLSTRRWLTSKPICTSTFIWKTTSCFRGRLRWNRRINQLEIVTLVTDYRRPLP